MTLALLSFTDKGQALAELLARHLTDAGHAAAAARCNRPLSLKDWTAAQFATADALLFVGATGIAVRAIAPLVKSKTTDPAVLVVDEGGQFVISLLSGHLGGANALTKTVAELIDATPVVTTATDVNGVFAVDEWTRRHDLTIRNPEQIKTISSALLKGETVRLWSEVPLSGTPPKGVEVLEGQEVLAERANAPDIVLTSRSSVAEQFPRALQITPKRYVLGLGCKRNTLPVQMEQLLEQVLTSEDLLPEAIASVSSIDLKNNEPGLLAFCTVHGWDLVTFSAEELRRVEGDFSSSSFVRNITGVDNVCERSAVLLAGGPLVLPKTAAGGVTMALAETEPALSFDDGEEEPLL